MRHRAERLLTTMRELQVGKSSWGDVQAIQNQWKPWGANEGNCTEQHCEYAVSLSDSPDSRYFAIFLFYAGHSHLANTSLRVKVEQGIVKETFFSFMVDVPKGYGTRREHEQPQPTGDVPYSSGEYELIAHASSKSEIRKLCCYWPRPVPHPTYVVSKPSGCTVCLAIYTEFLPQASPADKQRLTDFNFDCITRWKPCSDEEDIMPAAGAEYARQRQERKLESNRQDKCDYTVAELSQAALNAAVIHIESIPKYRSSIQEIPTVRLIKQLGGTAPLASNETFGIDTRSNDRLGNVISEAFKDQKPLIVLYPDRPRENRLLEPYTCGLLPFSQKTAVEVASEVSQGKGLPEFD